jgi:alpha-beta hydrolase superfamily lysophospholipase
MTPGNTIDSYTADILGNGFEQLTFRHKDDYEGAVVCTLVRKKATAATNKAVLYVHGFNDYFFQMEMADHFNRNGFDFYAVDLRKYGRSFLPHQKLYNVRDLTEYYADLDQSLKQIRLEGHTHVLLSGHSTGGLTASLYANDHQGSELFDSLFLNSPFYDINDSGFVRKFGIPLVAVLAKYLPNQLMKGGFSNLYGSSLHKGAFGEWEYNLAWKPHTPPPFNFGFVRALHLAHKKVWKGLQIDVPVLVMHSDNSIYEKTWSEKMFTGDAVLNVAQIRSNAEKISGNVTIQAIPGGMHDLILSPKKTRDMVYQILFDWLQKII